MTAIREKVGAKWFAGLMLTMLILSMANGFVLSAQAEEATSTPEETVSEPSDTPTEETTEVATEEQTTNESEAPADGEDGQDGDDIAENDQPGDNTAPPGEDGENGEDANATSTSDGVPSDIETGDATSGAEAGGIINVVDIDTNASSTATSTGEVAGASTDTSNASSTPESTSTPENPGSAPADIDSTQTLTASTTIDSAANTGTNHMTDPDGGEQNTGDGLAWADDKLFFNIALVDSSLQIEVLLNPTEDELDFREKLTNFFTLSADAPAPTCITFYNCNGGTTNATSTNGALLERNMDVVCNSGANYGGLINTGDCAGSGVMVTMGNWFAFNSNLMVLLVNQIGDMNVDVVLPEPSFFEGMRGGKIAKGSDLNISQNASSTINGASVANSGENMVEDYVGTGTAEADAATVNMINQLNPLTCFIVVVGGSWNGEIYQLPQGFLTEDTPFGKVICGRGEGSGDPEKIKAVIKQDLEMVVNALVDANTGGNFGEAVATGDAKSFLAILNVVNTVFVNQDWMIGLFTISGNWNGDLTFGARPGASPAEQAASNLVNKKSFDGKKGGPAPSKVTLTKTASVTTTTSPSTVTYSITLKNNGDRVYKAVLDDVLTNPAGKVVNSQSWNLGTILAGEEIVVEYQVEFEGDILPGNYLNTATLTGRINSNGGTRIRPVSTSVQVELLGGEVLGVGECPAYITDYISPLGGNDPEQVYLLESFLHDGRGENIIPDTIYDLASVEAVKQFQQDYAADILAPWGVEAPTGHVFYTTRKKINELYCNGEKEFPLSNLEAEHIQMYRNGLLQDIPTSVLPSLNPWSAIDFPLLSGFNLFPSPGVMPEMATAPATTPGFFSTTVFSLHPLVTLLRDIFTGIASGFAIEEAHAAN